MIIKVNRISNMEEALLFDSLAVDIIGISLNRLKKDDSALFYDTKAISLEEAMEIKKHLHHAKLALFIYPILPPNENDIAEIINALKPDYLNVYLSYYNQYMTKDLKKIFTAQVEQLNKWNIPIISFGETLAYDLPFGFNEKDLSKVHLLTFIEIAVKTLNKQNSPYIESEKGWTTAKKEDIYLHLSLETVQANFQKMNVLVDDNLDIHTVYEDLVNCYAKGITLSLKSLKPDVWTIDDDYNYERAITENMYEVDEIVEIIKRIKQGMKEFTIAN